MDATTCTCNITKMRTIPCANHKFCGVQITEEVNGAEKMAGCRVHRGMIAYCGRTPPLCDACTEAGFVVQRTSQWGFDVVKK